MTGWLAVIGSVLACIIGLWKFFGRKAREKRERIDEAKKLFDKGIEENDTSKITAAFDRLHRS